MKDHDVLKFVRSLGAKLASRSRHVCMFLGAGVGKACGLPDVKGLQEAVVDAIEEPGRAALASQLAKRDLEAVLSRLRRISALVTDDATVDDLTSAMAKELDTSVCQAIVRGLSVATVDLSAARDLAAWAGRSNYRLPLELFTVNYDLLLEEALETRNVPYFDGFVGTLKARFHAELVETLPSEEAEAVPGFFVRLWKLHGSLNWAWQENGEVVRLGQAVPSGQAAAIYPSDAKYEESRRVPFVVLQDRLRRALHEPETLLLVAGYSFGDEHLNEYILNAASRRARSEFIVFCFSGIPEQLGAYARRTPNLQILAADEAIVGGVRAKWEEPEDAPADVWSDGKFLLPDFRHLAGFLARSTRPDHGSASSLEDVLREISREGQE